MKLIIDIPDYEYRQIKEVYEKSDIVGSTYSYIYHGTPLDSNSEKAEVQAYFDGQAYGWEQGRKALIDDIMTEVFRQSKQNNENFSHDWNEGFNDGMFHTLTIAKECIARECFKHIGKAESEDE